jgi:hypothetical protein
VYNIAQANGIAGLRSNTVMFGWPAKTEKLTRQLEIMRTIAKIGKNTIICRLDRGIIRRKIRRIDLWWGGIEYNGDLMLLLAYLLRMNPGWERARIVIRSIVYNAEERQDMNQSLSKLMRSVRIEADKEVIVKSTDRTLGEIIKSRSGSADLVFFGLMVPEQGEEEVYAERLMQLARELKSVVFVRNASEFSGRLL